MSSRGEPLEFDASNADGRGPFQRCRRISGVAGSRQAGATCEKGGRSAATPGRMPQDNPVGDTRQGRPKAMLAAGTVAREFCELSNEGRHVATGPQAEDKVGGAKAGAWSEL